MRPSRRLPSGPGGECAASVSFVCGKEGSFAGSQLGRYATVRATHYAGWRDMKRGGLDPRLLSPAASASRGVVLAHGIPLSPGFSTRNGAEVWAVGAAEYV